MFARFGRTGSEIGQGAGAPGRNGLHAVELDLENADAAGRYECLNCGAHSIGLFVHSANGGWCSTCGGRELVPVKAVPADLL